MLKKKVLAKILDDYQLSEIDNGPERALRAGNLTLDKKHAFLYPDPEVNDYDCNRLTVGEEKAIPSSRNSKCISVRLLHERRIRETGTPGRWHHEGGYTQGSYCLGCCCCMSHCYDC